MIIWHEKIYIGREIEGKHTKLREEIEKGETRKDLYLITLSSNPIEQLDIFKAKFLARSVKYHPDPVIVGMALGEKNALELISAIAFDIYRQTGGVDFKKYFSAMQ